MIKVNPKNSKWPSAASVRQRSDNAGTLVEDLDCGHTVETPFTSLDKPYSPGVRRRCRACHKLATVYKPKAPRPPCNLSALDAIVPGFQVFPIAEQLSGIYCLMRGERVMYVGQSKNLLARLGTHVKTYRRKFDSVRFLPVPPNQLDEVEGKLIRTLRPLYNRSVPTESPTQIPAPENGTFDISTEKEGVSPPVRYFQVLHGAYPALTTETAPGGTESGNPPAPAVLRSPSGDSVIEAYTPLVGARNSGESHPNPRASAPPPASPVAPEQPADTGRGK